MKSPCVIRKWNGDELGKALAAIFPPSRARLVVWTGYLFIDDDHLASPDLIEHLGGEEPMIVHLNDGRTGQFRVTSRNRIAGEYAIEGTGPLESR